MSTTYKVTLLVTNPSTNPGKWDWTELLDGEDVELADIECTASDEDEDGFEGDE